MKLVPPLKCANNTQKQPERKNKILNTSRKPKRGKGNKRPWVRPWKGTSVNLDPILGCPSSSAVSKGANKKYLILCQEESARGKLAVWFSLGLMGIFSSASEIILWTRRKMTQDQKAEISLLQYVPPHPTTLFCSPKNGERSTY